METGCVVKSIAGHDKDRFYLVVKKEGSFAYIVDGRQHMLEKPKRKNIKHLRPTLTVLDPTTV